MKRPRPALLSRWSVRVLRLALVMVRDPQGRYLTKKAVAKARRTLKTKPQQVDRSAAARKAWETIRARRAAQLCNPQGK